MQYNNYLHCIRWYKLQRRVLIPNILVFHFVRICISPVILSHAYVFLGEVSVQFFCSVFMELFFLLLNVESSLYSVYKSFIMFAEFRSLWLLAFSCLNMSFFFFFGRTRVWTQGFTFFTLWKQALYCLSRTSSSFCWVSQTICLGWPWPAILPISASQIARITGMRHQHLAEHVFK
jgi:hypothetical protein